MTRRLAAGCALAALVACQPPDRPAPPTAGVAERIVALSPHLTELTFSAGAGRRLVGVTEFANFPAAARDLPRVGDAFRLDLEALAATRPDLVLGWPSGNGAAVLDRLRDLGYNVVELEPRELADIGIQVRQIGELAGTPAIAEAAAERYAARLARLRAQYAAGRRLRVFYQVAAPPLITATRAHFIGQAIELCGGENVFADLGEPTPVIGAEAVLAAAPDVIVANDYTRSLAASAGSNQGSAPRDSPVDRWRRFTSLPAVAAGQLYVLDPDLMSVPAMRMLDGIEQLCSAIARARAAAPVAAASPPGAVSR